MYSIQRLLKLNNLQHSRQVVVVNVFNDLSGLPMVVVTFVAVN